jgi:hypothetical protein
LEQKSQRTFAAAQGICPSKLRLKKQTQNQAKMASRKAGHSTFRNQN